jgi:tRNA acetyltransferase TAN1
MLRDLNLLATTWRGNETHARTELTHLLEEIGDSTPVVERTGISGLISARTTLDPFEVIRLLRAVLRERPYEFRHTLRVIPIERVVPTDLNKIQETATELSLKIEETETFRVTVEKRFTTTHTKEIVEAVAKNIKRKVNLTKPDRIILVEVLGRLTGVSLTKPEDTLSVLKEKIL